MTTALLERPVKDWRPNSRAQEAFFESNADELLYGGAAGGGKSEALITEALRDTPQENYHALLLRRTIPELKRTLIPKAQEMLANTKAHWNGIDRKYVFPNRSTIEFGHLQYEHDVHQYDSAEYDLIEWDELTMFTEFQYLFMKSRNRGKNPKIFRRMRAGSNPGRVGHAWVKRRFPIDKPFQMVERLDILPSGKVVKTKIQFIPALPTDNPDLMAADPGYIDRLEGLPEPYRSALRWGDWNINVGTFFEEWRDELHNTKIYPNLKNATIFCSMDWGYDAPCAIHWHALWNMGDFNRVITFREIYGNKAIASERADQIKLIEREPINYRVADPSSFNLQAGHPSVITEMEENGVKGWNEGNNDRVNGWMVLKEWLAIAPDGLPYWQVYGPGCPNLVRTLPEMVKNENNPEDVDTDGEDHAPDGVRYFFMSVPRPKKMLTPNPIVEEMSSIWFRQKTNELNGIRPKRRKKEYANFR